MKVFRDNCAKANEILLNWIQKGQGLRTCKDKFKFLKDSDGSLQDFKYFLLVQHEKEKQEFEDEINFEIPENVYICEICSQKFTNCLEYLDHQPAHDGHPVFKCDKCSEVFSTRQDLVQHDKNHKRPCPKCGKMILKTSMKLHLIKHTDRHMCSQCHSCFNSRAALQQHIITIHTDRKDHICEACGKRFSSKTAMTVHLKSHSDERLYECKLCNYKGRTASAVYVHMSTHAREICVCEVCSKIFKSNRNLNDHIRRVHSKEKKHKCTYCDKKFVDRYMLTVHVRCHTGVRPYACHLCEKAFIRSDGLKEHLATHGERVWFKCDKCGRKFASKKGVTRHHCT
ncbi:zinc finger protein 502-like isoform X2 [Tribolium madens]|uniref:zinc finger protein 502-like isoform X2 n=1 Tax=Tribolium madens TaxID=41895 RepID=UPI001CF73FF9|nr:zinc finger protein 502-like isoform X2 [Tribolium madens]